MIFVILCIMCPMQKNKNAWGFYDKLLL